MLRGDFAQKLLLNFGLQVRRQMRQLVCIQRHKVAHFENSCDDTLKNRIHP